MDSPILSNEKRANSVEWFVELKSVKMVQWRFTDHYQTSPPTRKTVRRIVLKFKETYSVLDRKRSGRPRTCRSEPNIQMVKDILEDSPTKSLRRVSSESGVGCTESIRRITRLDLKLKPYKVSKVHELINIDYPRREAFCTDVMARIEEDENYLNSILFSDEAYFYMDRSVLTSNIRIWSEQNPHAFSEHPLQPAKVMVWCGLTSSRILGPYFFHETLNEDNYLAMLRQKVIPALRRANVLNTITFQQDGAGPHTSNQVLHYLRARFPERLISWRTERIWPPRSPDLSPLDFFLWGHVKEAIKLRQFDCMDQLTECITQAVRATNRDKNLLARVMRNFRYRVEVCLREGGQHFEHKL